MSRLASIILFSALALGLVTLAGFQIVSGLAAPVAGPPGPAGPAGPRGETGSVATSAPVATPKPTPAPGASAVPGATGPQGPAGAPGAAAPLPPTMSGGTYSLDIADLARSLVEIPTSNVSVDSTTIASKYLAGTTALLDAHGNKVGTYSATFLSMQTSDGIVTLIENHFATDAGLVVEWSTMATPSNLELDSIVGGIATESTVTVTTKAEASGYFGYSFDLVVSATPSELTFQFRPAR